MTKKIIIDNNFIHKVFEKRSDCTELWKIMFGEKNKQITMILGGKLKREMFAQRQKLVTFTTWAQAGKLMIIPCEKVDAEEIIVKKLSIRSDDPHVLALARIGCARVLCTDDDALINDFRDEKIIPRPKGKIYKSDSSKSIL